MPDREGGTTKTLRGLLAAWFITQSSRVAATLGFFKPQPLPGRNGRLYLPAKESNLSFGPLKRSKHSLSVSPPLALPTLPPVEAASPNDTPLSNPVESFQTTHWSLVLSARAENSGTAQHALEQLCRAYWFPLYAYVRRQGQNADDAKDLTQEFFSRFLERGNFSLADRERGRFRTFLLTSLKRFLNEEWRKANRQKRGGGQQWVPLEVDDAENRFTAQPKDGLSPDLLYDRRWAEALLERVLAQLRKDYEATGRSEVYGQLQQFLWGRQAEISYAEMAQRLGINEGAVKVAVHRLRQRFRDLLREEVANTVETAEQIDEELRHLLGAFGGV